MHELSIVKTLIEQVQRDVRRSGHAGKILGIELNVGRLSGVSCDSIRFAFDLLAPGSLVEGANIIIHQPKPFCRCNKCHVRIEVEGVVARCPKCGSEDVAVEGGSDVVLKNINMKEGEKVKSGE